MADLKAEDIQRLVADFFTARAGDAEIAALHAEMENNPASAMEFLAQARAARGDASQAGLSAAESAGVQQRIEALIASRRRKPGLLGFFKRGPKPAPKALAPAPAPVPQPLPALKSRNAAPARAPQEVDLEDTAPIDEGPSEPMTGAPGSALAAMQALPFAPPALTKPSLPPPAAPAVPSGPAPGPPPPAPRTYARSAKPSRKGASVAGLLLLAALLGAGFYYRGARLPWIGSSLTQALAKPWSSAQDALAPVWRSMERALPAAWLRPAAPPLPALAARPASAAAVQEQGLALRADAVAPTRDAPLPAELPKSTPVASGTWN